jgi:Uncharacterised nucleotidyltransferase
VNEWEGEREVAGETFVRVAGEAHRTLDGAGLDHLFVGGVASQAVGRPRWTHDVDVIVRPADAERALELLGSAGFRTQRTDGGWLFKALRDGVLVDLVFRSEGLGDHPPVILDDEMMSRAQMADLDGLRIPVLAPEDLVVIKALVFKAHTPRHWHDSLSILRRQDLDWDYLGRRAGRHDPLRVASLLLYAESNDIPIPWGLVRELLERGMRWSASPTT